jgi:hypothetical protein
MQGDPKIVFIKNPSASSIVVETGDLAGEINFADRIVGILASSVTKCDVTCARPCVNEVWEIEFQDVDFGDCNACGKTVGFIPVLNRETLFDNQTYLDFKNRYPYTYSGDQTGIVTGAALATYFLDFINDLKEEPDAHDQFFMSVALKVGSPDTLVITLPCSGLVTYTFGTIGLPQGNNMETAELPVFTKITSGVEAYLSRERLKRQFPTLGSGHIFGEAPSDFDMWCEDICIIRLKGCIDPCSDFGNHQNTGHLHTGAIPFELWLYVNTKDSVGYADFIGALNAAITPCTLSAAPAMNGECYQAEVSGGSAVINLTNLVFNGAPGDNFSLDNGGTKLNVSGVTSGASLVAALAAQFPGGTFAYAAPNLTVSGSYAAVGNSGWITLCRVTGKRNYTGQ